MHLEMPRRQEFRHAREVLLARRGLETITGERNENRSPLPTAIERGPSANRPAAPLWLMDGDYIYPLHVGLNTLGRSPTNDLVFKNDLVSRRHCTILVHASNRVEVHDTASLNGTYVNGQRLSGPTTLHPGDEIRLCNVQLVFMTEDAALAEGPATVHE
jgi:hypothetical protein